jgi:hypothetical protein
MPVADIRATSFSRSFPMRFILGLTLLTGLAFGCGDDDGPVGPGTDAGMRDAGSRDAGGGTDAGPDDDDAGPDEDAGPEEDAGSVDGGGGGSCPDLMPTGDETLIISQIDFATSTVEVFNPNDEEYVVEAGAYFCDFPTYDPNMNGLGLTRVAARSRATIELPDSGWLQNLTDGELAFYFRPGGMRPSFGNGDFMVDYVCWGDGGGRRGLASMPSVGRWSGDCTPSPTNGAIVRLPSTSGTSASSYDSTARFVNCD